MENFPGNSKMAPAIPKAQREEPKIERVVSGEVIRRKTPIGKRLSGSLLSASPRDIFVWMIYEVAGPAMRDLVYEAFTGSVERAVYGEASPGSRRGGRPRVLDGYTAYNMSSKSPLHRGRDREERTLSRRARANHSFGEIILNTKVEADEILDRLESLIDKYDAATVANLYLMLGLDAAYTDGKWGWTDLQGARPVRVRGGYLLDLPQPEHLD